MRAARVLIVLINLIGIGFAAEPDSRLQQIQQQRQMLMLQTQNAQLSFENAQLKLKDLDVQEAAIKAEKPKDEKTKTK